MSESITYEELTAIAQHIFNYTDRAKSPEGAYAGHLAAAWVYADSENRDLLFPAWSTYVAKHRLEGLLK